ncbi:hypothetical protein C8R43DRAFT_1242430 [Mycena crocata]|nr:hypothetical protein C8R43DRAFT_1242430 [Mycena crocata]
MADTSQPLSGLDADPTAYLALPRFNHSLDFDFEVGRKSTVTYALTDATPDASWPILVFFNGLGGHRLIAAMMEGIAREHHVQILTLDKPGGGGSSSSTPIPLASRTRWMHTALLAVLAHHRITTFAALSHSNGLFYALYTLLHLPSSFHVTSWTLTGPFVPASISGAVALRLAAALPAPLPNALGALLQVVPPVAAAVSWSGGLLSAVGLRGEQEQEGREGRKPPHQRGYMHRHVGAACRKEIMRRVMEESRVSMGQEALLCLHGGARATSNAAPTEENSVWGIGPGTTDADVLRGAFARLALLYPNDALRMHVVYAADDGMVPAKGRAWLKKVLEGRDWPKGVSGLEGGTGELNEQRLLRAEPESPVGLVEAVSPAVWMEVPDAGHDDVLFLEDVVGGIFGRVGTGRG